MQGTRWLTTSAGTGGKYLSGNPVLTTPVRWIPHQLDASQEDLLQYCEPMSMERREQGG